MPGSRADKFLGAWDVAADASTLPHHAPVPKHRTPAWLGVVAVAVGVVAIGLATRGVSPVPPTDVGGASAAVAAQSDAAAGKTGPAPVPSAIARSAQPVATGDCQSGDLVLGKPESSYGFGALGTTLVFVTQSVRNSGDACVIHVPTRIDVARESGDSREVDVQAGGTVSSVAIGSGESVSLVVGAWWDAPGKSPGVGAPECASAISDVTRLRLPVGDGVLSIDLPLRFAEVCPSPASISVALSPA